MTEVKRYRLERPFDDYHVMTHSEQGDWVRWEDVKDFEKIHETLKQSIELLEKCSQENETLHEALRDLISKTEQYLYGEGLRSIRPANDLSGIWITMENK
jgi:hypothetical protein